MGRSGVGAAWSVTYSRLFVSAHGVDVHYPLILLGMGLFRTWSLGAGVVLWPLMAAAQNVAINPAGDPPANVALLDLKDNPDKGLLIPRIALQAANVAAPVAAPATGLLVYNTASAGAGQYVVTPGFYIWDAGQRWLRYEAMVRRPMLYRGTADATTSGTAWSIATGMQSPAMPLQPGDRVLVKAAGTAATAAVGRAHVVLEVAVDDGTGYAPFPNGSAATAFSLDNAQQNLGGNIMNKYGRNHGWDVAGYYDVTVPGFYTFAVRFAAMAGGTANVTSLGPTGAGVLAAPMAGLLVEVVRP